jgi:hypothetical protein
MSHLFQSRVLLRLFGALAALVLIGPWGCAQAPATRSDGSTNPPEDVMLEQWIPDAAGAERTAHGLVRVVAPELHGHLYVKPPRLDLQRYHRMALIPANISYKKGIKPWCSREEEILRAHFQSVLERELGRGNTSWEPTTQRADDALLVAVGALELDADTSPVGTTGSVTAFVDPSGGLILVVQLMDSITEEPLLRFAEHRMLPGGTFYGTQIDLMRVMNAFDAFADDLGDNIESYYAAVREIERREAGGQPN